MSDERVLALGLLVFGFTQVATGLLMVTAPGTFFDQWAAFGAHNDHYVRDVATINLAFGTALLWVARRPRWRVPVLALAALQSAFHTLSHIVDVGEPRADWQGVANLVVVAGGALGLLFMLHLARRQPEARPLRPDRTAWR